MAVEKRFRISLDVKQPTSNRDIEVVEGDTGNVLVITLTDNGEAVDLAGCKVAAVFAKPDGHTAQQDTDGNGVTLAGAEQNEITIDLYNTSFSPGMVTCEIQVFSGDNLGTLVTSAQFNFKCRRGIANEDTILATDEWPLLVGLLARVETADDTLTSLSESAIAATADAAAAAERADKAAIAAEEITATAAEAETARSTAESARATAEMARNAAESARTAGESARVASETARDIAEERREEAELLREEAEADRSAAETARAAAEVEREIQAEDCVAAAADAALAANAAIDATNAANAAADSAELAAEAADLATAAANTATDRANAAAEAAEEVVAGALPAHASTHAPGGSDPLAAADIGAAAPAVEIEGTLLAAGWAAGEQTVAGLAGVTTATKGVIGLAPAADAAARAAARRAALSLAALGEGSVTIRAEGIVPAVDIPFALLIVG